MPNLHGCIICGKPIPESRHGFNDCEDNPCVVKGQVCQRVSQVCLGKGGTRSSYCSTECAFVGKMRAADRVRGDDSIMVRGEMYLRATAAERKAWDDYNQRVEEGYADFIAELSGLRSGK